MSSTNSTFVVGGADGTTNSAGPGFYPAPPPPPPPPPSAMPGQVPALRINAVETALPSMRQRPLSNNNNPYEPPAAIQNAMMTKDKKPFTYTPGMGGKLDLSQIRSPRMARRVAKNANDEGIEGPPKTSQTTGETRPSSMSVGSNFYAQPQVAVPVLPTNVTSAQPASLMINQTPCAPANSRVPSNETKIGPAHVPLVISSQPNSPPETPTTTSPQVTLAKAPTPWLQNKNKPQDELPEWAKRSSVLAPANSASPSAGNQRQQQASPPCSPLEQQSHGQERIIPLRIEERPSVFSVKNETAGRHHQLKQQSQPSCHHQQRWGNGTPPQTPVEQCQQPSAKSQSSAGGSYIVPIMVEGSGNNGQHSPRVIVQRGPPSPQTINQYPGEPVQSRSFRVLQKITDTDAPDQVDGEQLRKLRLTENDKVLMNKVKERVDGDGTYLHQEEDPRYRGAAIPSRAFRYLQNMTESGDVSTTTAGARGSGAINKRQNRNSRTFEDAQVNLPASEQQAPEPKKYTGSAIPSRSFRILQAMTSPETIAKQENRQAVISETEISMQPEIRQQSIFLSSSSMSNDNSSLPITHQAQLVPSQLSLDTKKWHINPQIVTSQMQSPRMTHLSEYQATLVPLSFFQYSDGDCSWNYYPVNCRQSSSSSASSSSSSSSSGTINRSPIPNPISRSPLYERCEACSVCHRHNYHQHRRRRHHHHYHHHHYHHHHHHHHNRHYRQQEGNFIVYYHPLYDERFNAPSNAAVTPASTTGLPSSSLSSGDATVSTQQYTNLPVSSTSSSSSTTSTSSSSSSSCSSSSYSLLIPVARSTIVDNASSVARTIMPAFVHHRTAKKQPGNCNPCLESSVCSGEADGCGVASGRCRSVGFANTSSPGEEYSGFYDKKAVMRTEHRDNGSSTNVGNYCLTTPIPWSPNNNFSSYIGRENKGCEIVSDNDEKWKCTIDDGNGGTAGWNLDERGIAERPEIEREDNNIGSDDVPKWNQIDIATRNTNNPTSSALVTDNEPQLSIPMNILHQEQTDEVTKGNNNDVDEERLSDNSLNANDDSDDSMSDECLSSLVEDPIICQSDDETDTETSDDDNDDSESYMAYSTGLNPHEKIMNPLIEKELKKSQTATTISEDVFDDVLTSDEMEKPDEANDIEEKLRDTATPNEIGSDGWKNGNSDVSMSVSVSLPLRSRFSVVESDDDVCVNLKIPNDNVDSRPSSENDTRESTEDDSIDFWKDITMGRQNDETDVNCNSKKQTCIANTFSQNDTVFEEQDILSKDSRQELVEEEEENEIIGTALTSLEEAEEEEEEEIQETQDTLEEKSNVTNGITPVFELTVAKSAVEKVENDEEEDNEEERATKERSSIEDRRNLLSVQNSHEETDDEDSGVTSDMSRLISEVDTDSECAPTSRKINSYKRTQTHSRLFRLLGREDEQIDEEESAACATTRSKNRSSLPSLKNLRLTHDNKKSRSNYRSDLTSSANCSQTHEDKSTASWRSRHDATNPPINREKEELQSPRGIEDLYFETWKKSTDVENSTDKNVATGGVFKIIDNNVASGLGLSNWRFRRHVLCPRIKSTKNVPRTMIRENNRSTSNGLLVNNNNNNKLVNYGGEYQRC